mgnify:CR=1 FL=1
MKKIDKRTKAYKDWKKSQESIGLGDIVEKITEATGIMMNGELKVLNYTLKILIIFGKCIRACLTCPFQNLVQIVHLNQ